MRRCLLVLLLVSVLIGVHPVIFAGPPAPAAEIAQVQLPPIPGGGKVDINPPATPTITSPRAGATVSSPITVKGRAAKETKVEVTATLTAAVPLVGVQTRVGDGTTTADAKGAWQVNVSYRLPVKVPNARVVLEAVASNPLTGQKSNSTKIEVVPRQ